MGSVWDAVKSLVGATKWDARPPQQGVSPALEELIREQQGGQIQLIARTQTRWFLADLETAQLAADSGDISIIAQLTKAFRRDGVINGLMTTRTAGLVALPKRYHGDPEIISALQADNVSRSVFDEMFPASELAMLAADGISCGVGIAEMVAVPGREHPIMIRLDPEFLLYRWNENRWYFRSIAGLLPITPGDGRWILHFQGPRMAPWQAGAWHALGRAYITKEHALLHRGNFSAKLANPARLGYTTNASSEDQRMGFFQQLMAWGLNTVIAMPPGWEAKLLESNGRGWEVFGKEIETSDLESMITLAGQVVTVTGGTGFANADIHKTIRADLIKQTADALSHTINTQGIPPWVFRKFGRDALSKTVRVSWDIDPPEDLKTKAEGLNTVAEAINNLREVLKTLGREIDIDSLINTFGIPVKPDPVDSSELDLNNITRLIDLAKDAGKQLTIESVESIAKSLGLVLEDIPDQQTKVRLDLAPTDVAKVVRVDEARGSQGLPPIGDNRGQMMISELEQTRASGEDDEAGTEDNDEPDPEQ